jgi:hypothetical protein
MEIKKSVVLVAVILFSYCTGFSQTKEYTLRVLNEHLKNTCGTFGQCDEITFVKKVLWYKTCNVSTNKIPLKLVNIKTSKSPNYDNGEMVYYVELGCPDGNSCIIESGNQYNNIDAQAILFGFSNTIDQQKALRIFNHLKQLAKKNKDSFD